MSDDRVLTQEELRELTGAVHVSRQKRVLDEHGIAYVERADGKVATTYGNVRNPNVVYEEE